MSQTAHANFFSTTHTLCCVVGFEYSFRQFNQACVDAFGYSAEELNKQMFSELIHSEDLPKVEEVLDILSSGRQALSFQCRMRHHDGGYRTILWEATPSLMEFAFYAVGIAVDNFIEQTQQTARDEAREELVILQEKYADLELMYQEVREEKGDFVSGVDFEWQAIVDCMHEGVATRDPDGKLYTLNPQRTEELIGAPLSEEEFEILWEVAKTAKTPAAPAAFSFARLNRAPRQLNLFGLQHVAEDGHTPAGRTIIFSDMTEQSSLKKSLENMQEDWGGGGHLVGIMDWQFATSQVQYSGSWQTILGLQSAQLRHDLKTWQSRIHPGDFPLVMNSLKTFLSNKNAPKLYENVHRLQHSQGNYRWFKLSGEAKRDKNGKALRFIATFQDITDRKRLEDALQTVEMSEKTLRNERSQYDTLFNAVPLMIIYKDRNSQILRLNRYAEEWLGKSTAEVKGLSERELNSGYTDQYHADDQEVIQTGQPKRGIIEKSRGHYFRTDKLSYRDADGKILGVIVLAQDITEIVEAREILEQHKQ